MSHTRGDMRHWLWCGCAGGFLLGVLEATERAITLRPFLPGAFEPLGLWIVITGFVTLAGTAAGAIAALVSGAGALMAAGWPGGARAARRALIGLVSAAVAAAWLLMSLTLTTRFDRVLDRGPILVAAAGIAGAIAAPILVALSQRWLGGPPRWPARAVGMLLLVAVPVLFTMNLLFAPQSSVGIHVVLDTLTLFVALFAVKLLGPRAGHAGAARVAIALAVLLVATHFVMDASPRIASIVKTRGSTSRRAIRATAWVLDVDRDGLAPRWLTAGWDSAPFDPHEPARWVARMRPAPEPEGSGAPAPPPASEPAPTARRPLPRILFVTLDALRVDCSRGDRPTPLGALRPSTPTLDSLAAACAVFAAAYSPASGTEDTFTSLFADAAQPGLIGHAPPAGWLPARLGSCGYRLTAYMDFAGMEASSWGWPRVLGWPPGDPAMGDAAIDSLTAGGPAFAWVHWMPLHAQVLSPLSPQAYFAESQRRRYASGLAEVDALLGRMLARLRASGLAESTLVIVSADHGEELGGHGHFHHNLTLYEPAVRVPLWVSGPGVVPGERPFVVPQRDLYPTLIEAAGLDAGGSPSRTLWPALRDSALRMPQDPIYLFLPQRGFSRRHSWIPTVRGQAALVDPVAGRKVMLDLGRERVEAYDLMADPRERVNLAGEGLPWIAAMRAALDSALTVNARPPSAAATAGESPIP